jgi:hypothetical protein
MRSQDVGVYRRGALVLTLLISSLSLPGFAQTPEIREVPVTEVGPTQTHVGRQNAMSMVKFWQSKGKEEGLARYVDRKLVAKPFRGVVDPDGVVRILDGHHRGWGLAQVAAQYRAESGRPLKVRVQILKDYSVAHTGKDRQSAMDTYANGLLNGLHKGQFPSQMWNRFTHGKLSAVQLVRLLPKRITSCGDSKVRSAIGQAMFKAGIDLSKPDYVEFRLGDRLARRGLLREWYIPAGKELGKTATAYTEALLVSQGTERYATRFAKTAKERQAMREMFQRARAKYGAGAQIRRTVTNQIRRLGSMVRRVPVSRAVRP